MTFKELNRLCSHISYKAGWYIHCGTAMQSGGVGTIRWMNDAVPCAVTGVQVQFVGQSHTIISTMSETDVLRLAFILLAYVEDHEMKEFFRYKGKQIYDPHHPAHSARINIEYCDHEGVVLKSAVIATPNYVNKQAVNQ